MRRAFAALAIIFVITVATASSSDRDRYAYEHSWQRYSRVPAHQIHSLTVAVKQRNVDQLKEFVDRVSDPESLEYGLYKNVHEIADLVAPDPTVLAGLQKKFLSLGAVNVETTLSRDFLRVKIPISALESALKTRFYFFSHRTSGRLLIRSAYRARFSHDIMKHVDVITGIHDFPDYPSERKQIRSWQAEQARMFRPHTISQSAAPEVREVHGGAADAQPWITVYCANGVATQSIEMCSDHPPSVSGFVVTIAPIAGQQPIVMQYSIGDMTCSLGQVPPQIGVLTEVTCRPPPIAVPPHIRANVSVITLYEDGSQSPPGFYFTYFNPTPYVVPSVIFERYKVPLGTMGTNPNNSQSVVGFEQQYISVDGDLKSFFAAVGQPFRAPIIHGTNDPSQPGGESTLDIQYVMGVGVGINTTFWSVSGDPGAGGYILEWAMEIGNVTAAPWVTSISYGDTELGYFDKFHGWDYINRMNTELAKMAGRGMTVIAGSGDAGASNVGEMGNDLSPTDPTCAPFRPFFPSNSPYVLSASATFFSKYALPICTQVVPPSQPVTCDQMGEVAVSIRQGTYWTTGGGFSNYSAAPSWQQSAVANYLKTATLPPTTGGLWNNTGRGYPDISTLGFNLLVVLGGRLVPIGGTSASGPVLAGLVALLNDARLNHNLPTVGLMNPWLYGLLTTHPEAFFDIVVGDNRDGDVQPRGSPYPSFCDYGFNTAPGWDPVTGLGTPNWYAWKLLSLQAAERAVARRAEAVEKIVKPVL